MSEKAAVKPASKAVRREMHPQSMLMTLSEAVAYWLASSPSAPLTTEKQQEISRKALATEHNSFAPSPASNGDRTWKMIPLLWLRLFMELDLHACQKALVKALHEAREREGRDEILLFTRRHLGSGRFQGQLSERYPGRLLRGFTAMELLLGPAPVREDPTHWPYNQEWKATSRFRKRRAATARGQGTPDKVAKKWARQADLVRASLMEEVNRRQPGGPPRLIEPNKVDGDLRPYRTSLRIPELAAELKQRYPSLGEIADSLLAIVVRQGFVRASPGRPKGSLKPKPAPSRDA